VEVVVKDKTLSLPAILRGALLGLMIVIPVSIVLAIVYRVLDRSATKTAINTLLVLALWVGYAAAGVRAGRTEPRAPFTNGALAALLTLVFWLPVFVLIRLVRGEDVDLRVGTVFGQAVIAAFIGMLAAWVASRRAAAQPNEPADPPAAS
jgi:hypothetical protein